MPIPASTYNAILLAIDRFDQELRGTSDWLKWEEDVNHKYAIRHEDRLYPVKKIVSLATSTPTQEFSGGDEVNKYVRDLGFKIGALRSEPGKQSWIFQSSPKYYDVIGAIQNLKELTWLVAQNKNQIHTGNKVFLWEAGQNAGVVGVATVMTEPGQIPPSEGEKPFLEDETKFAGLHTRVILHIERVLSSRLLRKDLMKDQVLAGLAVIKFPNATNFSLTPQQTERLEELVLMDTTVLRWNRVETDSFDLKLENVDAFDRNRIRGLYEAVVSTKWAV